MTLVTQNECTAFLCTPNVYLKGLMYGSNDSGIKSKILGRLKSNYLLAQGMDMWLNKEKKFSNHTAFRCWHCLRATESVLRRRRRRAVLSCQLPPLRAEGSKKFCLIKGFQQQLIYQASPSIFIWPQSGSARPPQRWWWCTATLRMDLNIRLQGKRSIKYIKSKLNFNEILRKV